MSSGYRRFEPRQRVLVGIDEVGTEYGVNPINGEVMFDGYGFRLKALKEFLMKNI